jgi:putative membrane protein
MNHIIYFIVGIFIGTGLILPGVSGAVLAIALGVYDKLLKVFSNIFSDFKKNIIFLTPIMFGVVVGTVFFGKILLYLFNNYPVATKTAFIGLILGSLPIIFNKLKTSKKHYEFKIVAFVLALAFGILLYVTNEFYIVNESVETLNNGIDSSIKLFLAGFVYSIGKIIPGISSSFMLMTLGMYEYILFLIANPMIVLETQLLNVIIFTIGFLVGVVVLSKTILILFKKQPYNSYSAIIGFIIGSILILFPKYHFDMETYISIIIFIIMFAISLLFSLYENNKKH